MLLRQPSALLRTLTLLYSEILRSHRNCDYVVHVTIATEHCLDHLAGRYFADAEILLSVSQATKINTDGSSQDRHHGQLSNTRFGPCYLFVYKVNLDGTPLLDNWPETVDVGGSMHQNFHVFILMNVPMTDLLRFAQSTARLLHAVQLHPEGNHAVGIFKLGSSGLALKHILTCATVDKKFIKNDILVFETMSDLERTNLHVLLFCGKIGCAERLEEFRRTGLWYGLPLASTHELNQLVNGTLKFVDLHAPHVDGRNKATGKWDAWTQPLVDGTAEISIMIRSPVEKSKVVYPTIPFSFENVVFATRKARKVGNARSWARLLAPFTPQVWLYWLTSVVALLVTMKWVSSAARCDSKGGTAPQLFAVLVKPILGQPPVVCEKGVIGHHSIFRLLLGMWLLSLIILVFGYTSTMTSHIVLPSFENLPTTFEELANSNFTLFGKYWKGTIEKYFESLNNTLGRRLLSRVVDTNMFSTEV